ncbi:DUF1772-domain-containing protein [Cryphonectria parasitica EP155]|uniref:DUF1772-domain-containing protein n=1 Tax=Cryphonectria parasitica (strain ATCC 38755 / EP155) TaxID=660469 RepID=A0A9P5CMF4_CRYP1|nr:DUF1772-domain-containing protein [Cryphonectria parasitica EP155]KAF3763202.1 DUF1772-domain-containing protein [Cryphonectria parasitica EP155]
MALSAFAIPVFLETNDDPQHLLDQWARLYHYGHIYMPAICVATCGLYGYAAASKRTMHNPHWHRYAQAAVLTISMVPFTWLVISPTNDTLFGLRAGGVSVESSGVIQALIVKWAWLHITRSFSPLFGAVLGFTTLLREIRM